MSSLFLRTLREDPADAEVPSHTLLVRGGYVRRVAPGIYTWLPLGLKVLDRVARVVREEMDRIGAQEVLFPALLPREPYEQTGRWSEYGDLLFRLADRRGADYLLGPTHEEMFTTLVKGECSSYRDLPLTLYQVQTKYRDEARPRAGVLRGREFVMKDSYSFDLDDAGLQRSYDRHREAYIATFTRLGLDFRVVSAMSGAMGGSASEEFLAPAPTGEDTFVSCSACDYTANTEAVTTPPGPEQDPAGQPPMELLDTPDTPTIESLVQRVRELGHDVDASRTLKNVVVKLRDPATDKTSVLVVGVPGDREVDLRRLEAGVAPAEVLPFEAEDFAGHPGLVRGYIGPQVLRARGYRYLVDPRVATGTSWITGANQTGVHAAHVVAGRDFIPDGTVEAAEVRAGDACPRCGSALTIERGIEIGHIFQLGRKYCDAFELDVLGPDGERVRLTMGSYGIGVSRAVAAIVEQHHDERGICWPSGVAPFDVHLVPVGRDATALTAAAELAEALSERGVEVLLDDREASAGVKFADADLVGVPTQVVLGKGLASGTVEVKDRRTGERTDVALADVADVVAALAATGSSR
jgi:prolyl-tRNA synthetase